MANNEEQNIVDKAKDVARAAEETSKLAANLASGNFIGAAKNALNLLKNKEFKKKLKRKLIMAALQCMIPIIMALCFFAALNTIKDTMIDLLSNAGTSVSGFLAKAWQWLTGGEDGNWIDLDSEIEYIIDSNTGETLGTSDTITDEDLKDENGNTRTTETKKYTLVDQYIKELGSKGISLEALRLLGDADYSNEEEILEDEENKVLVEKYIAEFIRADIITQQPHRRSGSDLVNPNNQNQVDGGVYFYRNIKQTSISDSELNSGLQSDKELEVADKEYKQMTYVDSEEFIQMANNNDPNIKYNFSIDKDTGELLIAEIKTTSLIDKPLSTAEGEWFTDIEAWVNGYASEVATTYEVTVKREDYKKYISKYSMPYEFLINLCEITQNPEFVYHVALLARDTKIILGVQDNTTVERETIEVETDYYDYINFKNKYTREATSSNKNLIKTRKVTTTTTETPVLTIQYADTWSFYEDKEYTKTTNVNTTQTEPNIEDIRKATLSGHNEAVYMYENQSIGIKVTEEAYQSFETDVKIGFERVEEEPEYWYENNMASEKRTATQMVTKTITYNEAAGGQSVEKSKQFLGLLRNTTGKCDYNCSSDTVSRKFNPVAIECSRHAEFDRDGINVQYRIPNMTRTESPLNKLLSGLDMLYAVLQSNSSGYNEEDKLLGDNEDNFEKQDEYIANEDYESTYVVKMQGLVEHLQHLMTFPDEDSYTIKDIILEYLFGDDNDGQGVITTVVDDIIVKTDEMGAAPEVSKNELIAIINASSWSELKKNNAISLVDVLIEGQRDYKVNPIFMLAIINQETSVGTANTTYVKQHNNWTSYNLGITYATPQENMQTTIKAIANGNYYFKQGKTTIKQIGYTYCPNTDDYPTQGDNWVVKVTNIVKYLYSLIGENVGGSSSIGYDYMYTSSSGKTYRVYRQNDYINTAYGSGTIANKGCGLTADATVLSGYGIMKNPEELLNGRNIISIDGELTQNGLSVTRTSSSDTDAIKEALEAGNPVIVHVNSNSSYTNNEHWMPLLDIRESNGNIEVYVANPNRNGREGWDNLSNVKVGLIEYIIVN